MVGFEKHFILGPAWMAIVGDDLSNVIRTGVVEGWSTFDAQRKCATDNLWRIEYN